MAFNLGSLLNMGQVAGSLVETPEEIAQRRALEAQFPELTGQPDPRDTILVNGVNQAPNVDQQGAEPPFMGNRKYREEVAMANQDPVSPELQRRGMFGMRGTLRDIVGTLGDAFLVQGGNDPMYAPQRQRERASDAMAGFTNADPRAQMAAIERLAQVDPAAASSLYEQMQTNNARVAQQQGIDSNNKADQRDAQWTNYTQLRNFAARTLSSITDNPENLPYALQTISAMAQRAGFSLEDLGITDAMTPEQMGIYSSGDMTVSQQRNLPLAERRVVTGETNAETMRNRPPPARAAPRSETDSERAVRIGDTPPAQRSAGETEWYNRWRSSGSGSDGPPLPPSRRLRMTN